MDKIFNLRSELQELGKVDDFNFKLDPYGSLTRFKVRYDSMEDLETGFVKIDDLLSKFFDVKFQVDYNTENLQVNGTVVN